MKEFYNKTQGNGIIRVDFLRRRYLAKRIVRTLVLGTAMILSGLLWYKSVCFCFDRGLNNPSNLGFGLFMVTLTVSTFFGTYNALKK